MSDILGTNVIVLKTPDSIVFGAKTNPVDYFQPLTFTQWVVRTNVSETDSTYLLEQYKLYLLKWYKVKNLDEAQQQDFIRSAYIGLLREIVLSYSTLEERRYITNVDLTNDLDLYSVLPFFVKKIKTICSYYNLLRENVKFKKYENSLKGSHFGVETVVLNEIIKSLNALDVISTDNITFNLSSIKNNIKIGINEFYDDSQYFDLNPSLPYNTYNQGTSSQDYTSNLNDFNERLFTDFESTIVDAIKKYPFFLNDFKTTYSINFQVDSNDLEYLKDKDFINQINNLDQSNLNLQLEKELIQKFIGTDYYFLSTGDTITNYTSGILFKAEDKVSNFLNKRFPSTATVPNDEAYLKEIKQIGGYFLPDKLGVLNFNTLKYNVSVNTDSLQPNKIYVFPDPTKYGNISNLSKTDYETPLIYEEDVSWMVYNRTAQYIFGNIKSNPLLKDFYAYHSRSQTVGYTPYGMSRDIDSTEFFTGTAKDSWQNADVFPVIENVYPLEERQANLLVENKTLVVHKTDIYGNNYGLYKEVNPVGVGPAGTNFGDFISQLELDFFNFTGGRGGLYGTGRRGLDFNQFEELKEEKVKPCLVLDGHLLFDIEQGYNFDYTVVNPEKRYSGVYTRTVTQVPPGSGYYTSGDSLTSFAPDPFINYDIPYPESPPPRFKPLPFPLLLIAYGKGRFIPDEFCDTFTISYCLVLDCITFVDKNSNLLLDYSSDLPTWNTSIPVYYNELLEGSLNTSFAKPDTLSRPATFSYTFPVSSGQIEILNAYNLNLEGQTPCEVSFNTQTTPELEYVYDKRDFKNLPIPVESNTAVQILSTTLTRNRSIYESRYQDKGEFFVKNANTTRVDSILVALSSVFNKYDQIVKDDIAAGVYHFDLFYNVILLETENYLIMEKLDYDYENNVIIPYSSDRNLIRTFNIDKKLEKIGVPYFRESDNKLFLPVTTLFSYNSCSNEKILYPEIYEIDLNIPTFKKIYPNVELTFNNLSSFTNPIPTFLPDKIDKPILVYNPDSDTFVLNYFAKNPNDVFVNTLFEFKIGNSVFNFLKKYAYVPQFYIKDYNFCNLSFAITGNNTGYNVLSCVENNDFLYFAVSAASVSEGNKFERCINLDPTPTPTQTPTVTPTPSVTPTTTPTPTPSYSPVVCGDTIVVSGAGTSEVNGAYILSSYLANASVYVKGNFILKFNEDKIYDDVFTGAILSGATNFEVASGTGTLIYATSALIVYPNCIPVGTYDLPNNTYSIKFSANTPIIGALPYPTVNVF